MKNKMKYILPVMAMTMASLYGMAQNAIDTYFGEYADNPNFTTIAISSKMFSLFSNIDTDDPDSREVLEAMSGLDGIKILTMDDPDSKVNYSDAIKKIAGKYEVLMSVDEKDEKVRFYVREEGDDIRELFMIVGGPGELLLMSITGDIDLNKMSKISKSMNIGGMNYLDSLNEKDKDGQTK